jgi:hypothetical protein
LIQNNLASMTLYATPLHDSLIAFAIPLCSHFFGI